MLKKEAAELFAEGFNCSQSVFSVFAEKYGLPKETALKIGCGFGGGMRNAEVCGAVTACVTDIAQLKIQMEEAFAMKKQRNSLMHSRRKTSLSFAVNCLDTTFQSLKKCRRQQRKIFSRQPASI